MYHFHGVFDIRWSGALALKLKNGQMVRYFYNRLYNWARELISTHVAYIKKVNVKSFPSFTAHMAALISVS